MLRINCFHAIYLTKRFQNIYQLISNAFSPFLSIYVKSQERNLSELILRFHSDFENEINQTCEVSYSLEKLSSEFTGLTNTFLGVTKLCRFICLLQKMFGPMFSIINWASIIGPQFRIVSE